MKVVSVQQKADEYFNEYKQKCMNDISFVLSQYNLWNSVDATIATMPIEEQAKYADYVTCKLVDEVPKESLLPYIRENLDSILLAGNFKENESCAIANTAKFILCLPENEKAITITKFEKCLKK